jgi:hypothetical protein
MTNLIQRSSTRNSRQVHKPAVDAAARAVYDGQDRIGSYKRIFDRWVAVDRLGRPIGQFSNELEAQDAITRAVRP